MRLPLSLWCSPQRDTRRPTLRALKSWPFDLLLRESGRSPCLPRRASSSPRSCTAILFTPSVEPPLLISSGQCVRGVRPRPSVMRNTMQSAPRQWNCIGGGSSRHRRRMHRYAAATTVRWFSVAIACALSRRVRVGAWSVPVSRASAARSSRRLMRDEQRVFHITAAIMRPLNGGIR